MNAVVPSVPEASAQPAEAAHDPFATRVNDDGGGQDNAHHLRPGIKCGTEDKGHAMPRGRSIYEIVVDASGGFIPLWEAGVTLNWRFREASFQRFSDPAAAKAAIERLFATALIAWGDAVPVRFTKSDYLWDFEIAVEQADNCSTAGCTLARAFFPDSGRHDLIIFPKMFKQSPEDQVEIMAHEIGHIFGLRHFFALTSEKAWPALVFGEHRPFSIMNYGDNCQLTAQDRFDLKQLYSLAWSRKMKEINGTPIRLVRPYHDSGNQVDFNSQIAAFRGGDADSRF